MQEQSAALQTGAIAMSVRPNLPVIGVRFDIDALDQLPGSYGQTAWATILGAFDIHELRGCELFEGDTLLPNEYVYCIAFQCADQGRLKALRTALENSREFQKYADKTRFSENVRQLPLVPAGVVNSAGEITILNHSLLRPALAAKEINERKAVAVDLSAVEFPPRKTPASPRMRDLPDLTSVKQITEYLLGRFRGASQYMFYVTPEELCDIVDRYRGVAVASSDEYRFGSGDEIQVILKDRLDSDFVSAEKTRNTLKFNGMGVFTSNSDAKAYVRDSIGVPDDVTPWGIQDRFLLNFQGSSGNSETVRPGDSDTESSSVLTADELWKRICERRAVVGIGKQGLKSVGKSGCLAASVLLGFLTTACLGAVGFLN